MKNIIYLLMFITFIVHANENQPMYGGMDRITDAELYQQDQLLILKATNTFGTTEHASIGYVDSGFEAHLQGKHDLAMQRFNEAWTLDKTNPYSYVGFGVLYQHKGRYCKSMEMFDLAKQQELEEPGFLADYALIINQCANSLKQSEAKSELKVKANSIYELAEKTPNERLRAYVYQSWAESALMLDMLDSAIKKIELIESLGQPVNAELKQKLRSALEKS
ncbi:MAG: hypothetical protein AAF410_03575 [Pseudomonadota bacterium]